MDRTARFPAAPAAARLLPPLALVAVLLPAYVATLLPGVGYSGDTAKFQFLGHVLGTPHPTGYPTYILLNHLFVRLFPWGTIAFRANLLSAVFAIGAVLFLYHTLRLLGRTPWVAFAAALLFGFTRTFWSQAVVAEVYTLNALFVAAVVAFFLRWHLERRDRDFYLACLLYALSFGNHLTMITFLPAIVYLVWATDRRVFTQPQKIGAVGLFIALGAAQYLYILWRSLDPASVYLETRATTLSELLAVVSGGIYQNQMFAFTLRQLLFERVPLFLKHLAVEYHLFPLLALYGFFRVQRRPVNVFLLLSALGNLAFSLNYNIADIRIYFIPTYFVVAVYVAYGLDGVLERIMGLWPHGRASEHALALVLLLIAVVPAVNAVHVNQRRSTRAGATLDVLQQYPPGRNVLLVDYGYRQYLFYGTFVEGRDFRRLHQIEAFPWGYPDPPTAAALKAYLETGQPSELVEVPPGWPVYCAGSSCPDLEKIGFRLRPVEGDLYEVVGVSG